jgi:phospholipid/cholesterol/gamma-HCH transport system substrate-binding protein
MNRNVVETTLGAIVLLTALVFLGFALRQADATRPSGYNLIAAFSKIDGIKSGSDVRISGIKAGSVTSLKLDDKYRAVLTLSVDNGIKLPTDTAAVVASNGLLGEKYISLEPGGDTDLLKNGSTITMTQSPPGLEQLLGQVIFSMTKSGDKKTDAGTAESDKSQ